MRLHFHEKFLQFLCYSRFSKPILNAQRNGNQKTNLDGLSTNCLVFYTAASVQGHHIALMKRKVTGKSPGLFTARKEIPNLLSLYTRTRGMPKQWGNILSENRKIFAFCSNKPIQGQLQLSLTYPTTSRWLWFRILNSLPSFYRGMSRSILYVFSITCFFTR